MESRFLSLVVLLLCARLSTSQVVVRSFSGTSEELLGVQVSSSGELLVRSSERVYVINTNGGGTLVSSLNGSAVVFQQSDILSSGAALRCEGNQCGLHSLTDLRQEIWSSVNLPQMVTGLSQSIITQLSDTTISLNTAEVVEVVGGRYLDARRYDFEFASTNFSSPPTSVRYRTTDAAQICTGEVPYASCMYGICYTMTIILLCVGIIQFLKREGENAQLVYLFVCLCLLDSEIQQVLTPVV